MQEDGIKCKVHKILKKVKCKQDFSIQQNDHKYQDVINTKEFREYSFHIHFWKNVLENKIQKTKMT